MNDIDELDRWRQQWQANQQDGLNFEHLSHQARRRNRREQFKSLLEVVFGLVTIGFCVKAATGPVAHPIERGLFLAMAFFVAAFLIWVLRQRRLNWEHRQATVSSLIALERQRLDGKLRYWRISYWCVFALLGSCLLMATLTFISDLATARTWLLVSAGKLPVLLATGLWMRFVKADVEQQHQRLDELDEMM
jgi:hypothetical protein